ncbi:hypothetical protein V5O48_018456, partial [Marasmius crinis-equi]
MPSWFPGTHYATVARSHLETAQRLNDTPIAFVRERMTEKNYANCFASELLQEMDDGHPEALSLNEIKRAAAAIFGAGEDSTFASLLTFYLVMVLDPECQKRAYDEIVTVVGENSLPDLKDRESLPYVECIVQEVVRWNVIAPFSVPHRAINDDYFNGMFIPKGSMILPNARGMSIDENVYSNPKTFNPSRFLPQPQGKGEPHFTAAWGFGRRICPGRHLASLVLWHAIACTLAVLEIVPKTDEMGKPVLPEVGFSEGLI